MASFVGHTLHAWICSGKSLLVIVMKKLLSLSVLAASVVVAGCTAGGTTYGTGVSHETQTVKAISNMFSIRGDERPDIDYASRPDLVMPPQRGSLPQPLETEQSTSNVDWPETPEERIARIRGEAVEADERSGELPLEEMRRKKYGIAAGYDEATYKNIRNDEGGNAMIDIVRDNDSVSEEVKRRRSQMAYSTGPQRKYLTEPPVEYRTPAATAAAGDLGYNEEELKAIEEKAEKEAKARETGLWVD